MIFRALAFTALACGVLGQVPASPYAGLKVALGLTDFQMDHLLTVRASALEARRTRRSTGPVYASRRGDAPNPKEEEEASARNMGLTVLTEDQRRNLIAVAGILPRRRDAAAELIRSGVISCGDW